MFCFYKNIIRCLMEPLDEGDDEGIWRDFIADLFASLREKEKFFQCRKAYMH